MTDAQTTAALERLQRLIPEESDTELLTQLLEDAEAFALGYTGRRTLPSQLVTCVGDLAVVAYNRLGTEGDGARSEGGESYTFNDAPRRIYSILDMYRLARVGGKYHEAESSENQEG